MASNSISDRANTIDQPINTNQLTKNAFINRYLTDFAKRDHKLHYSDKFAFGSQSACEIIKFYKKQQTLNPIHDALMHIHALSQGGAA